LFVLGGTLQFNAIQKNLKYLGPTLTFKLLILPAIMLALGYMVGLRELELFLLVAVYGTPVAAASYPMAQNMGGDGELAGEFVVISTVAATFTLFLWIFFMKSVGLI
ncbi:MAG: AEC family transporter, partial [Lachnospiraceae bacterium]|nr:AEC family transporter [Lachnospiraceae bacterium]